MKIVCDSCQAKYSIADEKIQGKAFKIRCKKCNHIIVVKPSAERSPAPEVQKPVAAASTEPSIWHIVVDGGQVGPLPLSEVKTRLSQGQIRGDTLVWKDGLSDWMPLSNVPELSQLVSAPESAPSGVATDASAASSPVTSNVMNHATVGGEESSADAFAAPTVITPKGADLFASPIVSSNPSRSPSDPVATPPPGTSNAFTFGGASPQEPALARASTNTPPPSGMTGQRNENSVLFSLSNLEALAVPPQARAPSTTNTSEGSGLIDIRSMAAVTLARGSNNAPPSPMDALPTFSTPQFSPVAPLLLPETTNSAPKWVYPVLGLIGIAIAILSYALIKVVSGPSPGQPVPIVAQPLPPQVAPITPPAAPAVKPTAVAPVKPSAKSEATANDQAKSEKPAEKAATAAGMKRGRKAGKESETAAAIDSKKRSEPAASEPSPTVAAAAAKPAAKKGSMDDVLGDVGGNKRGAAESKPAEKLATLTQSDIVSAMRAIQPKIQNCANQFKVPGTALADISVVRGGKVGSAVVKGKFAGSPTGACVEAAVKTAKFPPSESITFPFPFTLSPR